MAKFKPTNTVTQIISLLLVFGPIVLFWYVDWYLVIGYYNLVCTYESYIRYEYYDNHPNYTRKYHLIIYVGLPLIFNLIGYLISVVNGFEENKDKTINSIGNMNNDFFETEGKNYFDFVENPDLIIELNDNDEIEVLFSNRIIIRELIWDQDQESHYENDAFTLGIEVTVENEEEEESELYFRDEDKLNEAGFHITEEGFEDHPLGESPTKKETENLAIIEFPWLKNII